jgi:LPS-assembly protein
MLDAGSGLQYLMATLGEVYRFATPRVTLPDEIISSQSSSDLIGELRLGGYKNLNAGIGMQWDPNSQHLQRTEVNAQYIPGAGRVMNVGYVYRRPTLTQTLEIQQPGLEQVYASAAWPVGNRVNLFGRYTYSLQDERTIDTLAGLEYRDCCWGFRFGMAQSRNQNGELEVSWKWQVELNGLTKGNVGSASDTILSQQIPGYSASRIDRRSVP